MLLNCQRSLSEIQQESKLLGILLAQARKELSITQELTIKTKTKENKIQNNEKLQRIHRLLPIPR